MDDKLFNELEANLKEAVKVAKRHMTPKTTYVVVTPAEIKAIRRKVSFFPSISTSQRVMRINQL